MEKDRDHISPSAFPKEDIRSLLGSLPREEQLTLRIVLKETPEVTAGTFPIRLAAMGARASVIEQLSPYSIDALRRAVQEWGQTEQTRAKALEAAKLVKPYFPSEQARSAFRAQLKRHSGVVRPTPNSSRGKIHTDDDAIFFLQKVVRCAMPASAAGKIKGGSRIDLDSLAPEERGYLDELVLYIMSGNKTFKPEEVRVTLLHYASLNKNERHLIPNKDTLHELATGIRQLFLN